MSEYERVLIPYTDSNSPDQSTPYVKLVAIEFLAYYITPYRTATISMLILRYTFYIFRRNVYS